MRHGWIKTAAATPRIKLGDAASNAAAAAAAIARAAAAGAQLVVLPARVLTGATAGDLASFPAARAAVKCGIETVLASTGELSCIVFFGAPLDLDGEWTEGVYAVSRGGILGFVPAGVCAATEAHAFERDFAVGRDLVFVCEEDADFSVAVAADRDAPSAAHALAYCVAEPEFADGANERRMRVRVQSARRGIVLAGTGAGESTTDYWYGGPRLIAEDGEILADGGAETEGITLSELDFGALAFLSRGEKKTAGRTIPFRGGARVDTALTRRYARKPFVFDESICARILDMQAAALAARVEFTHAPHLVLGVSGGLDSTLALLAACRALDRLQRSRLDLVAVTMPCFGTSSRTLANATRLMRELGVTDRKISIRKSVLAHFNDIDHDPAVADVAYENAQARERTQVLMDLANQVGGFVVGTGDLSEAALGWATFNGDHMSMYNVNASLPKTTVRAVVGYAKDAAEAAGDKALARTLADILETPISPELLPTVQNESAQKTEDAVGPYELHDFFLYQTLKRGAPPDKILRLAEYAFAGKFASATIEKWLRVFVRRFFASQFKRNCAPDGADLIGLGLSPRAFAMPSDMTPADWLAALDR